VRADEPETLLPGETNVPAVPTYNIFPAGSRLTRLRCWEWRKSVCREAYFMLVIFTVTERPTLVGSL
jgi:hypothetical protein